MIAKLCLRGSHSENGFSISLAVSVCLCLFCFLRTAHGNVEWEGSVWPDVPTDWTSSMKTYIGNTSHGKLSITDGSEVFSYRCRIGNSSDSTGEVTVDGTDSLFKIDDLFRVGLFDYGKLHITGGGSVSNGLCDIGYSSDVRGEIVVDGPGSAWTTNFDLYVGRFGSGAVTITNGAIASSKYFGYIGYESGSSGEVTVAGAGSTWYHLGHLYLGQSGSGRLNVYDGGMITVEGDIITSCELEASCTIHLDNGAITTDNLLCSREDITGKGTIDTHGIISDIDLIFDATHGVNQTFYIEDESDQVVAININVDGSASLGAGYKDVGTMQVSAGRVVNSKKGYIGYQSGSTGEVTITDPGSAWIIDEDFVVGNQGVGSLRILDQGMVSVANLSIGVNSNVELNGGVLELTGDMNFGNFDGIFNFTNGEIRVVGGTVNVSPPWDTYVFLKNQALTVTGNDSRWECNCICFDGATLSIANGGTIHADTSSIGWRSETTEINVDGIGSIWTSRNFFIACGSKGSLKITSGGQVINRSVEIGTTTSSIGEANVDGNGSLWTTDYLRIGHSGFGKINITNGGAATNTCASYVGYDPGSTGEVVVDGVGSKWTNQGTLNCFSNSRIEITNGGLISVAESLIIHEDSCTSIYMSTGGMLALHGSAEDSLLSFLNLFDGQGTVRFWDESIMDWADIMGATFGDDYTLKYLGQGELAGYTVLTVGVAVPEPGAVVGLLGLCLAGVLGVVRRR